MAKKINTNSEPSVRVKPKAAAAATPSVSAAPKSRSVRASSAKPAAPKPAAAPTPEITAPPAIAQIEPKPSKAASPRRKKAAPVVQPFSIIGVVEESGAAAPAADGPEPGAPVSSLPQPAFTITHADIARLAFSYWEARGRRGGSEQEDWARAERELRSLLS